MLILALFGAFVLYVVLYYVYETAQNHIGLSSSSMMAHIRQMVFYFPESQPLAILKWGIILFAFYLLADGFIASVKRHRRKSK